MPSTSLRARIQAFEALNSSSSPSSTATATALAASPTPPPADNPADLLESPMSPAASSFHPITPFPALPSPSTPGLARQTSLIDLKDWIVEDGPLEPVRKLNGIRESPSAPPTETHHDGASNSSAPLISFELPSKPRPPLPPRRPSSNAADRGLSHRPVSPGTEKGAALRPPLARRPDSLTSEHTYPPGPHKFGAARAGHAPASSISSFHSVSLSDGGNVEVRSPDKPPSFSFEVDSSIADFDTASISESFESVSVPSTHIPSFDWERPTAIPKTSPPKREPPSLPNRAAVRILPAIPPKSLARSTSTSSSSTATSTKSRRPPPPLPHYHPRTRPLSSRASLVSTSASTSDRSSILSSTTSTSRTSTSTRNSVQPGAGMKPSPLNRPTPVPSAARSRYESLFDSAVKGRRKAENQNQKKHKSELLAPPPAKKGRQASGWRDLSVEPPDPSLQVKLGENEEENEEEQNSVGPEERLSGRIIKYIWSASRLDRKKLESIWNDCDPQGAGFIDRDAFVKGMWRIDEELRRAQLARRTLALNAASSQRIPHRPFLPPRSQRLLT